MLDHQNLLVLFIGCTICLTLCQWYASLTSSKASGLKFWLGLHLHPDVVYATSEGFGESTYTDILAWVFAACKAYAKGCEILCRWPIQVLGPMKSSMFREYCDF